MSRGALRTQARSSTMGTSIVGTRSAGVVFASDGTRTDSNASRIGNRRALLTEREHCGVTIWGTRVDRGLRAFFAWINRGWRAKLASTKAKTARRVVLFTVELAYAG